MVESVKPTTIKANDLRIGAVTRVANTASAVTTAPTQTPVAAAAPTLARVMAASPPMDVARIALIKEAVEAGRFPLSPASVADALIAAKYEWMSHDAS